jgi:hypothetical protein
MKYYDCKNCGAPTPNRWRRKTAQYCSVWCRTRMFVKEHPIPRPSVEQFGGRTKLIEGRIIVNEELYDWLNQYKWYVGDTGYAMRRSATGNKKQTTRMHRVIVGAQEDQIVDHINRDKLDNRIENLRIVTSAQNVRNTTRFDTAKRYCWDKSRERWLVRADGKYVGRYRTEQEAIDRVKEIWDGRHP